MTNQDSDPIGAGSWRELRTSAWVGAAIGVATWLLSYIFAQYVIGLVACRLGTSLIACEDSRQIAAILALIVASVIGLVLLVRERFYRPLFVMLAAVGVLWGITGNWLVGSGYIGFLLTVLTVMLVYVTITWLSAIRSFWIALIVSGLAVLLFRLIIMS